MSHRNIMRSPGLFAILVALGACTDETVNLGGGRVGQQIQRGERCAESNIVAESLRITNQSELEALAGCEEIDGDLRVELFSGADLGPLASLRVIRGLIELGAWPDLGDGAGSEEYQLILDERERVVAEGYLPSLAGLEALEQVAALTFYGIAAEDLAPLQSLRQLFGRSTGAPTGLVSIGSTRLRSLHGLENLEGAVYVGLADNAELESLAGFAFDELSIDIAVIGSPRVTSLAELSSLTVLRSLELFELGIGDLNDLTNLYAVEDGLDLVGNPNLIDVDRLADMSLGSLRIEDNALLESVPPLGASVWLDAFVAIDNPALRSIQVDLPGHGMGPATVRRQSLTDPIGVVEIGYNENLTSVSLAAGLEQGRVLAIYENPSLARLSLGTLERLDELRIEENPSLGSVELGALRTVQSLSVTDNPSLDTTGLGAVRTFETLLDGNASDAAGP